MQSLEESFNVYINECQFVKRLRPETIRGSKEAIKHFLKLMPELLSMSELTTETVTLFFKRLQTRERVVGKGTKKMGIKDSTAMSYAGRLKTFFKWLTERHYIDYNPFEHLSFPRPAYIDHRALTGEEIKKIMGAVVQAAANPFLLKRDLAMIAMLTFCGLRRNELVSLEMRDIDLFNGYVTVRPETSKSKTIRKVPINMHLKMHISEYQEERKRVGTKAAAFFVSNRVDKGLTKHGLKHWVARISHLSSVKVYLHRFRHTFATNLAMQDVGLAKIQKLMGHKDIKMTQTYLRSVSTEDMINDVNKLSFETLA